MFVCALLVETIANAHDQNQVLRILTFANDGMVKRFRGYKLLRMPKPTILENFRGSKALIILFYFNYHFDMYLLISALTQLKGSGVLFAYPYYLMVAFSKICRFKLLRGSRL